MRQLGTGAALILAALAALGCEGAKDSGEACGSPDPEALPVCGETRSAPSSEEAIRDFVRQNAVALRCPVDSETWSLRIFREAFAGRAIFMMGEAHGSAEIGPASAALFESLARDGAIDRMVIEIPMDAGDAIAEYIETGGGPLTDLYDFDRWPDSLFWRALPMRARELRLAGTAIPVYGIDVPWRLAWVNEQIGAMAESASPAISSLILDPLPEPREMEDDIDADYVDRAREYYRRIHESIGDISAELSPRDCLRLETLARALTLGAENQWPDFWSQPTRVTDRWFDERELLLFDGLRAIAWDGTERIYAHMGAYHAAKAGNTVAGMLDRDNPPTQGAVYSVVPVAGPGSVVLLQDEAVDFPSAPALVAEALAGLPAENYFLPADSPGRGCVDNPFANVAIPPGVQIDVDSSWGASYDAFFFFNRLTGEEAPD